LYRYLTSLLCYVSADLSDLLIDDALLCCAVGFCGVFQVVDYIFQVLGRESTYRTTVVTSKLETFAWEG